MLEKVLRLVMKKGTMQTAELARDLHVTPAVIEQWLNILTGHGYLQIMAPGCSEQPCKRCPLRTMCTLRNQPRIWALTSKGEKFLHRVQSLKVAHDA